MWMRCHVKSLLFPKTKHKKANPETNFLTFLSFLFYFRFGYAAVEVLPMYSAYIIDIHVCKHDTAKLNRRHKFYSGKKK